jgi:hypothetical protein
MNSCAYALGANRTTEFSITPQDAGPRYRLRIPPVLDNAKAVDTEPWSHAVYLDGACCEPGRVHQAEAQ